MERDPDGWVDQHRISYSWLKNENYYWEIVGDSNSIGHIMMKITRKYIIQHIQKTNHVKIPTILLSNGMDKGQREFNILKGIHSRNAEMQEFNNFLNEQPLYFQVISMKTQET